MRRTLLRTVTGRLGMACYALWVALALVTQDAMPCPTHDGAAAVAVAMAIMPGMQMGAVSRETAHADAQVATHAHHATRATREASHGAHHGHVCTCVGCGCCVAALDALGPSPVTVPAPAIIARGTTAPLAPRRVEPPRADRRLPFANAPPLMVSTAV